MTLIARNKILTSYCIVSIIFLLGFLLLFLVTFFTGGRFYLPIKLEFSNISIQSLFFNDFTIFPIISTIFFGIYAVTTSSIIRYTFEKTQSPEIIFFFGFLIGCLFELLRLLIPILNLWDNYSTLVIFIGKTLFAGRLISIICFLFSSIFVQESQGQETERNLLIIIVVSCIFAEFIPVNAGKISSSLLPEIGFYTIFYFVTGLVFIITVITLYFTEKKSRILGFVFLYLGYISLTYSSNFLFCTLGIIFTTLGTKYYLENLHNYYLWK